MRRILSILTAAVLFLLLPLSPAGADASSYWDEEAQAYMFTEIHYGIVICTKMNVRDKASTSGASYGSIRNGQPVKILGITKNNDFYVLDLDSCALSGTTPGAYGYAKSSLIRIDPEFIATTRLTNLYATPWTTELKNGEQTNRFFLVIAQYNNWYAVQATDSTPGTAFIRMNEIGQYTHTYGGASYVVTWDAPLYDESTWTQRQTARRFSTCTLTTSSSGLHSISSEYSLVVFDEGTRNEVRGWILNQFLAPLLN